MSRDEELRRQLVDALMADDELRAKVIGLIRSLSEAWAKFTPAQQCLIREMAAERGPNQ